MRPVGLDEICSRYFDLKLAESRPELADRNVVIAERVGGIESSAPVRSSLELVLDLEVGVGVGVLGADYIDYS